MARIWGCQIALDPPIFVFQSIEKKNLSTLSNLSHVIFRGKIQTFRPVPHLASHVLRVNQWDNIRTRNDVLATENHGTFHKADWIFPTTEMVIRAERWTQSTPPLPINRGRLRFSIFEIQRIQRYLYVWTFSHAGPDRLYLRICIMHQLCSLRCRNTLPTNSTLSYMRNASHEC